MVEDIEYYSNGKLKSKMNWKNGVLHGKYESFNLNNDGSMVQNFKNGCFYKLKVCKNYYAEVIVLNFYF